MKEIYLHVGYTKTGTSFMRGEIFPRLKGIKLIKAGVEKILPELSLKRKNLISDESIIMHPVRPHKRPFYEIDKLKNMLDGWNIKIIIGIRAQHDIIAAVYKHYLHTCGTKDIHGFLDFANNVLFENHRPENRFFSLFKYSVYIDGLVQRFGRENIYIYVFENLKKDREAFLKEYLQFLGIDKVPQYKKTGIYNRGYGSIQMKMARVLNKPFQSHTNPKGFIPWIRIPKVGHLGPRLILQNRLMQKICYNKFVMPLDLITKIKTIYDKDNRLINQKYNLNLPEEYFIN